MLFVLWYLKTRQVYVLQHFPLYFFHYVFCNCMATTWYFQLLLYFYGNCLIIYYTIPLKSWWLHEQRTSSNFWAVVPYVDKGVMQTVSYSNQCALCVPDNLRLNKLLDWIVLCRYLWFNSFYVIYLGANIAENIYRWWIFVNGINQACIWKNISFT